MKLDHVDCQILAELQRNGRISNAELADRVNLSPTPCLRRLRKLEQQGLIREYTALLDRTALGLEVSAFAFVKLDKNSREHGTKFEAAVARIPEVMECCLVASSYDYVLRVVAKDLTAYERFLKDKLANLAMVSDIETMIILNEVMHRTALPI